MMPLDHDLANVAALDAPHKFAENDFRLAPVLIVKNAENPKQNQR
jgi:hypothetical protein